MKKLLIIGLSIFFGFCVLLTPHNTKAATATSKAGIVDISYGKLNVRSSSSTNSSIHYFPKVGRGGTLNTLKANLDTVTAIILTLFQVVLQL